MSSYFIAKSRSGSTAPSFGTKSRTWPYEARTVKSLPRYLLIVLALAGDSTMRRFLAMGAVPRVTVGAGCAGVGHLGHESVYGPGNGPAKGRGPGFSFLLGGPRDRPCQV